MTEVVRCRYVTGVLAEIEVEDLNEFVTPGAALEQRLVKVNGRLYVRKYVSRAAGSRNPRLYDLLHNEIRAGTRLGQVFPERYPAELAQLVAYNVDAEEPFVLLREYVGAPASPQITRFDDTQRRRFESGLLRALQLTAQAGVVHGAVTVDSVRWDDGHVQLVDFESAERVGEPRRGGASGARSPEQAAGTGVVDERDDLWGAALLIRGLHIGGTRQDRSRDPQRLRELLDPVFDNPVDRRPTAADLLGRMHADNHVPPSVDPDARFADGRALFERVCARKRGPTVSANESPPAAPTPPGWRGKRFFQLFAAVFLVSVLIIGVVVLT
ncbi:hypothetical protein ALI22I_28735 [Saccharothrix sp. ALI-22-I]|uniref:hypothetical protein n=1 Tax=Saccharothrix sp. ALI-22-I TaxID=1933778 RepID=UPI00097C25DD|nr:hypothetical protein [Saccharothrix sp. ALI-22-I]ONI84543.1 hypothetical protein ALI22I_28735 [Saccharothrix sp. ALI-22-I]